MSSSINPRNRLRRSVKLKVQPSSSIAPFQQSLTTILIDKCQKCTQELQKGNIKAAKDLISSIQKDLVLLNSSQSDYNRLMSLVYNLKASYHRKLNKNEEALKYIDEAIVFEKCGNVDRIDMARTLLNKSVIMGQMARDDKNLYSHEAAISLAKQALQIIKNRPEGKQFVQKEQYKLGQIIIISFHNIATELICLKNQQQGYNLYKRAYDLSLRVLGPRHHLTGHLKNIIAKLKEEKSEKRRIMTEQVSPQKNSGNIPKLSANKQSKKISSTSESKKFKSFFEVYGYSKEKRSNKQHSQNISRDQLDMHDLNKLQKLYKPASTSSYLPEVKRKNVRDIINQGRQTNQKRVGVVSANLNQKKEGIAQLSSSKNQKIAIQRLKTEQIKLPQESKQVKLNPIFELKKVQSQETQKLQQGGCQLI